MKSTCDEPLIVPLGICVCCMLSIVVAIEADNEETSLSVAKVESKEELNDSKEVNLASCAICALLTEVK